MEVYCGIQQSLNYYNNTYFKKTLKSVSDFEKSDFKSENIFKLNGVSTRGQSRFFFYTNNMKKEYL